MEAVAIGDTHFDALTHLFEDAIDLMANEVRKPLDYAVRKGIRNAFFLGDTSNKHVMSYRSHMAFMDLLEDYDDKLDIHVILGNHDIKTEEEHSLQLIEKMCRKGRYKHVTIHSKPASIKIDGVPG